MISYNIIIDSTLNLSIAKCGAIFANKLQKFGKKIVIF